MNSSLAFKISSTVLVSFSSYLAFQYFLKRKGIERKILVNILCTGALTITYFLCIDSSGRGYIVKIVSKALFWIKQKILTQPKAEQLIVPVSESEDISKLKHLLLKIQQSDKLKISLFVSLAISIYFLVQKMQNESIAEQELMELKNIISDLSSKNPDLFKFDIRLAFLLILIGL